MMGFGGCRFWIAWITLRESVHMAKLCWDVWEFWMCWRDFRILKDSAEKLLKNWGRWYFVTCKTYDINVSD